MLPCCAWCIVSGFPNNRYQPLQLASLGNILTELLSFYILMPQLSIYMRLRITILCNRYLNNNLNCLNINVAAIQSFIYIIIERGS